MKLKKNCVTRQKNVFLDKQSKNTTTTNITKNSNIKSLGGAGH